VLNICVPGENNYTLFSLGNTGIAKLGWKSQLAIYFSIITGNFPRISQYENTDSSQGKESYQEILIYHKICVPVFHWNVTYITIYGVRQG